MRVKVRLENTPNSRGAAASGSSLLTLAALGCTSLGLWRIGKDLDLTGDFVFPSGFLSHWQVWIASAIAAQYGSWHLKQYAKQAEVEAEEVRSEQVHSDEIASAAANG